MKVILNIIGSCPPPASLTAILQTTVSPHSWLITKQQAASAGAVGWMFSIPDYSKCQTRNANYIIFLKNVNVPIIIGRIALTRTIWRLIVGGGRTTMTPLM